MKPRNFSCIPGMSIDGVWSQYLKTWLKERALRYRIRYQSALRRSKIWVPEWIVGEYVIIIRERNVIDKVSLFDRFLHWSSLNQFLRTKFIENSNRPFPLYQLFPAIFFLFILFLHDQKSNDIQKSLMTQLKAQNRFAQVASPTSPLFYVSNDGNI